MAAMKIAHIIGSSIPPINVNSAKPPKRSSPAKEYRIIKPPMASVFRYFKNFSMSLQIEPKDRVHHQFVTIVKEKAAASVEKLKFCIPRSSGESDYIPDIPHSGDKLHHSFETETEP